VRVQRQYSGTAGKVDNCQLGVFLAYASPKGRAMIDRELYLPKSWTDDPERCKAARVPEQVGFRTKPELAQLMLERALDAGVPASWVTADEVYGGSPALREWLERRQVPYVLAVKCTELLEAPAPNSSAGTARTSAEQLAAGVPTAQWITCSAGYGAKGRRLYDWTRVELAAPATTGMARWLLVRRSRSDGELAFYACYGPAATPLIGLVRVAGTRWAVEEGFEQAKGEVGLDHYEVRKWPGWYPPHHPGAAGARVFGRHPRPGQRLRAGNGGAPPPERRARPAAADRPRGPPAAGGAGVDDSGHAWVRAGVVALASASPGPRPPRPLPAPPAAATAGLTRAGQRAPAHLGWRPCGCAAVGPCGSLRRAWERPGSRMRERR
jgi:hypothetical protein